jgi:hypothetical protein
MAGAVVRRPRPLGESIPSVPARGRRRTGWLGAPSVGLECRLREPADTGKIPGVSLRLSYLIYSVGAC